MVISHRLATLKSADRIIVMNKGRLVEDGSHKELLRNYPIGVYANMINV